MFLGEWGQKKPLKYKWTTSQKNNFNALKGFGTLALNEAPDV